MKTLQEMLHARASGDNRAATGVVDVRAGRVRILFGDVGPHSRLTLGIEGNEVRILHPTDLATPAAPARADADAVDDAADAARRRMTPDNVQPGSNLAPNVFALNAAGGLDVVVRDGKLYAGDAGPEIILPPGFGRLAGVGVDVNVGQPIERPQSAGGEPSGGTDGAGDKKPEAVNPADHLKDELIAMAKAEGVEVTADNNKAEIAAAINRKRGIAD